MAEPISVPKRVGWDAIHALVKGGISGIPFAGGIGAEFFELIVKPPLLKKQERWMAEITDGIFHLTESFASFDPRRLVQSEDFAAAVLSATRAAMKTTDEVKLGALRNILLNTALTLDRETHIHETLLFIVDRVTGAHLSVLDAFSAYEVIQTALKEAKADPPMPPASDFRTLSEDIEFTNSVTFELIELNLIFMPKGIRYVPDSQPFWTNKFGHLGTEHLKTTELGRKLLKYISSPTTED